MQRSAFGRLLVTAAMVSLGGCKLLGNQHLASNSQSHAVSAEAAQVGYGPATQRGRDMLRNNQVGLAIDSFNLALVSGEDPAAAYNGLGVSYARLGRADLGYRFFKKAVMSDPANPVYEQNLVRLVNSNEFTLNLLQRSPLPEVAPPAIQNAARTADAGNAASREPGRLYRERNRQFTLVTLPPQERSATTAPRNASADACPRHAAPAKSRSCSKVSLPKVESRTRRAENVALAAPVSPAQDQTVPDRPASARGKARIYDLGNPSSPGNAGPKPETSPVPALTAAT